MLTNKSFGDFLYEIRTSRNVTVRDLAKALGIHYSYISKLEKNIVTKPSEEIILGIAAFFDIDSTEAYIASKKVSEKIVDKICSDIEIYKFLEKIPLEDLKNIKNNYNSQGFNNDSYY